MKMKTFFSGPSHNKAMDWFGLGKNISMRGRVTGVGFLGLSAVAAYQSGGTWGAAKSIATDYGIGRAIGMLGGGTTIARVLAVAAVAGGVAAYTFRKQLSRPWVKEHMKKHARLEMGTPTKDDFGNVATMRQRSLQAINNSKLNGRTALGNEAALMYTPYSR